MVPELLLAAEKCWCRINALRCVELVQAGVQFLDWQTQKLSHEAAA